jgi:hypothetical protein
MSGVPSYVRDWEAYRATADYARLRQLADSSHFRDEAVCMFFTAGYLAGITDSTAQIKKTLDKTADKL